MNSSMLRAIAKLLGGRDAGISRRTLAWQQPRRTGPKHTGSHLNHGRGESKARRKMAAASNRINRQRTKRWKH